MTAALIQTSLPPAVPPGLTQNQIEGILIALTIAAVAAVALVVLKPLVQALARRIEGRGHDHALRAEVEVLEQRLAEVEPLQRRVLDLEERLEFTERLLAQRRDQELIGPGGGARQAG